MSLCQSHDFLSHIFRLEIDGDQDIVVPVFCDQTQNFIDGRHFLLGKFGIEPTACIQFTDLCERQFGVEMSIQKGATARRWPATKRGAAVARPTLVFWKD